MAITTFRVGYGSVVFRLNKGLELEPQQVKIRYLPNHYENEDIEKTGYSGVPGFHGSGADGEGYDLHPRCSQAGVPKRRTSPAATSHGANQEGSPATADSSAWLLTPTFVRLDEEG